MSLANFGRTGDVRALADVHEIGLRPDGQRLQPAQARVRLDFRRHARRQAADRLRQRLDVRRRGAAAAPHDVQPAVLRPIPGVAAPSVSGVSGKPVGSIGLGRPGIRMRAHINVGDARQFLDERPHLLRPSAQLMPMLSSRTCEIEFQYASTVWPESVRPLKSVMVNDTITGTRRPASSKYLSMANSAAFEFSESNTVSTSSKSTPPSISPRVCS